MADSSLSSLSSLCERVLAEFSPLRAARFAFLDHVVQVRSNSGAVLEELGAYFVEFRTPDERAPTIDVVVLEGDVPAALHAQPYAVVQRSEPAKKAKEAYVDLPDGRLVHKVRTDMHFACTPSLNLAVGPARENLNQVINFINTRLLQRELDAGGLLGHCAAVTVGGQALVFAGTPGAGKSTLALELMRRDEVSFLSNDRVVFHARGDQVEAVGVPKHPRINPGTALANPLLRRVLSDADITRFSSVPPSELWPLEHKYDAVVHECFGPGRFGLRAPVAAIFVLAWHYTGTGGSMKKIDLRHDERALAAIMKDPGPFYFGSVPSGAALASAYCDRLAQVPVYRFDGAVRFDEAASFALSLVDPRRSASLV